MRALLYERLRRRKVVQGRHATPARFRGRRIFGWRRLGVRPASQGVPRAPKTWQTRRSLQPEPQEARAAPPSAKDPYLGLSFGDQFRIERALGAGAMARVFLARQLGVERDVAIKILKRELMGMPDVVARFRREAELAARLSHPHIVVVHAIGRVPELGPDVGGEPYTALEYLDGPSLAFLLEREGGKLPLGRALHIVLGLCDAIGEAHARGVVHRDLKPENVLLVRRGDDPDFVKVLDFGLAKAQKSAVDLQTRAGAVLGTPRYVSPEGAQGDEVGPAADCYALATLLYQCLTGRTPFEGSDALSLLSDHAHKPAPELASLPSGEAVPEPLARVIMENLSKRPERRAPDARAFGRALVEAARSSRLEAAELGLASTLLGTRTTGRTAGPDAVRPGAVVPSRVQSEHEAFGKRVQRRRARLARRLAVFAACFFFGVLAALGIAAAFGVFDPSAAPVMP